jgi:hypothetical protein
MDRQALIADLRQARACVDDAGRHIQCMIIALASDAPMPRSERSWAAEKLNRASEYVRRAYDG